MAAQRQQETPPSWADDGAVMSLSLLDRLRANDPGTWQRLVALYTPLMRFWCGRAGLHGPDAEDVAQEVFAAAAAGLAGFRHDRPGDTFRGWLRGIARNHVLLHFRRNHGRTKAAGGDAAWAQLQAIADPLAGPAEPEETEVGQLYRRALDQVRGEFEHATWQAFWLTAVEGRAPAALADELGMSTAAIRQAKSRVLRRLKCEVGDLLD